MPIGYNVGCSFAKKNQADVVVHGISSVAFT